jgi:phosphoesterase RecJ-like protein
MVLYLASFMKSVEEIITQLNVPSKRIFITTHHKPDGDAIGSMLGLYHYLVKKGHQVTPVSPSELPDFLLWMPGADQVLNYEDRPEPSRKALDEAELVFCLDFNDFGRVKLLAPALAAATAPKVVIDHHLYPAPVWDYGVSIPEKSSTCEMVYDFILQSGDEALIDKNIATCLYTGAMTDTGSFRFPATSAAVHEMVATLMRRGAEPPVIHEKVFDSWSVNRMRFIGYMLIERMEIFPQWQAGLVSISRKDLQLFSLGTGDTEGVVNYPLSISGVRFSTLITERSDEVRLSFRSKGDFDVNAFAREYFSGGGHFNASGGRSSLSFSETVARFKEILSDIHPR